MSWIVEDWAGNEMPFGEFESFEDAWGFVRARFDHLHEDEFDAQMQEFEVVEKV